MATQAEAQAAKDDVRRKLKKMGAVVVSIGIQNVSGGVGLAVGVSRGFERLAVKDIEVENVPVHIFKE